MEHKYTFPSCECHALKPRVAEDEKNGELGIK